MATANKKKIRNEGMKYKFIPTVCKCLYSLLLFVKVRSKLMGSPFSLYMSFCFERVDQFSYILA
jgi:hypothetical protein